MSDARDLTGVWYGDYGSPHPGIDPNGFIALIEERGGALSGTITERDIWRGTGLVRADVDGARSGAAVRFRKQYDGSGGMFHAVDYAGRVNDDATEIAGTWSMEGYAGRFTMTREKFAGVEVEDEEEVTA